MDKTELTDEPRSTSVDIDSLFERYQRMDDLIEGQFGEETDLQQLRSFSEVLQNSAQSTLTVSQATPNPYISEAKLSQLTSCSSLTLDTSFSQESTPQTPSVNAFQTLPISPGNTHVIQPQTSSRKYEKILKPDVLKSIMSLKSASGVSEPHMMKLADGTWVKINFGTVKKRLPEKRKKPKRCTHPLKYIRGSGEPTKPKKKRIRKPHPLKDKICDVSPPCGEIVATYKTKEELEALVVRCPSCTCYHCPLCPQTNYKPAVCRKPVLCHVYVAHWQCQVPIIIDEQEYFTVKCRLLHGGITCRFHLHCPCGTIIKRSRRLKERFTNHRKLQCPLTKHLHPGQLKTVDKHKHRVNPTCFYNSIPQNKHHSVFETVQELLDAPTPCVKCFQYHCIVCPVTSFAPSSHQKMIKHLRSHYKLQCPLPNRDSPFFIGCKLKHGEVKRRPSHHHCLCGQIVGDTRRRFLIHMKSCQHALNFTGNKENYTNMTVYPKNSQDYFMKLPFIKAIQICSMIPRNSMPIYSHVGEKIPPPLLVMSVFENLRQFCSVIKRCYTCCTRYHCPLCPVIEYVPSSRIQLANHIKEVHHKFLAGMPSGQVSYPCYLNHGKNNNGIGNRHYHCVCSITYNHKTRLMKHMKKCDHASTRILNPAIEHMRDYLIPETQLQNTSTFRFGSPAMVSMNTVEELYAGSSSDEEMEDSTVQEVVIKTYEMQPTSFKLDHPYNIREDEWHETIDQHLEAKAKFEEQSFDHNDDDFGLLECTDDNEHPVQDASAPLPTLKSRNATMNLTQSDASCGIFNPFDLLVAQLKQCTDCCDLYHCPFCSTDDFKPVSFTNAAKHLKVHWGRRVFMIDGTFAVLCNHDHDLMLNSHYHCMCGETVQSRGANFNKHLKSCEYMLALAEDIKNGVQEPNLPMPSKEMLIPQSHLKKVVDDLSNWVNSPDKKKKRKGNSREYAHTSSKSQKRKKKNINEPVYDSSNDVLQEYETEDYYDVPITPSVRETETAVENVVLNGASDQTATFEHNGRIYDIVYENNGILDINSIHFLPEESFVVVQDS